MDAKKTNNLPPQKTNCFLERCVLPHQRSRCFCEGGGSFGDSSLMGARLEKSPVMEELKGIL